MLWIHIRVSFYQYYFSEGDKYVMIIIEYFLLFIVLILIRKVADSSDFLTLFLVVLLSPSLFLSHFSSVPINYSSWLGS